MKVGVVGLGTMGAPMARHLLEAGHDVTVWNRTQAKEEPLAALGAARASTPAEVAQGADAVLTCVSDDPDIEAVVYGPSAVASTLAPGSVLVDSSTVSPSIARSLASRLAEALGAGAADSWALRNRTVNMINETYPLGFRTSLHLKDVRIALGGRVARGQAGRRAARRADRGESDRGRLRRRGRLQRRSPRARAG
jgi:3-hydroxyisobutyrate dehydrogenase-like beta-hydroxyacid dehydrogenase